MSVLDFLKPHDDEYMTGYYYENRPNPTHTPAQQAHEDGQKFHYAKATGKQKRYFTLMNIRADSETYTIRTCDDCHFKNGGYISTQNGLFWCIDEIVHEEQTAGNEEALLLWTNAVKTEFIIRMTRVDNPWGIGR